MVFAGRGIGLDAAAADDLVGHDLAVGVEEDNSAGVDGGDFASLVVDQLNFSDIAQKLTAEPRMRGAEDKVRFATSRGSIDRGEINAA